MGLFGKIVGGIADVATGIIPGTLDDKLVDAGRSLLSGGNGGGGSRTGAGQMTRRGRRPGSGSAIAPPDDGQFQVGPFRTSPVDFGPVEFDPSGLRGGDNGQATATQNGQAMSQASGFMDDMAMQLIFQTMGDSSMGRALVEALTSGSLQNGIIQSTVTVNTPRGQENHSPPGFRTVYINDEPYAIFKPFAKSLGLLKNENGLTFRQKLDKQTRQFNKNRRFIKDIAKKVGLKTSNRKSGPAR